MSQHCLASFWRQTNIKITKDLKFGCSNKHETLTSLKLGAILSLFCSVSPDITSGKRDQQTWHLICEMAERVWPVYTGNISGDNVNIWFYFGACQKGLILWFGLMKLVKCGWGAGLRFLSLELGCQVVSRGRPVTPHAIQGSAGFEPQALSPMLRARLPPPPPSTLYIYIPS